MMMDNEDREYNLGNALVGVCRRYLGIILLWLCMMALQWLIFFLYGSPMEPFWYVLVLGLVFLGVFLLINSYLELRRLKELRRLAESISSEWRNLPEPESLSESEYQCMVQRLAAQTESLSDRYSREREDMLDYYTIWVHQIKTPIAVMRMRLGIEDSENNRALAAELFRIEQYVDMVLQYIRLGSDTRDLVVQEYSLDELIRESIRKHASQFIHRKLRVQYEPSDLRVVTDKKWFGCIMDQLLSNAIKYTPQGSIHIDVTPEGILKVSDTGIGIAPEDIPRIFDKGYTGINGRGGSKSSGLGLYLCKKAAKLLAMDISVESEVGKGTTFLLNMKQGKKLYD